MKIYVGNLNFRSSEEDIKALFAPYGAVEDLMRVKGIGQATFDKLKEHIVVR